jgi:hypothetical protein
MALQRREDTLRELLVVLGLADDFPVEQLPMVVEQLVMSRGNTDYGSAA